MGKKKWGYKRESSLKRKHAKIIRQRQKKGSKTKLKDKRGLNLIIKSRPEIRLPNGGVRRPLPPSLPNPDQSSRARNPFSFHVQLLPSRDRQGLMGVGMETDRHPDQIFPPLFFASLFSRPLSPPVSPVCPPIAPFGPVFPPYFSPSLSPRHGARRQKIW